MRTEWLPRAAPVFLALLGTACVYEARVELESDLATDSALTVGASEGGVATSTRTGQQQSEGAGDSVTPTQGQDEDADATGDGGSCQLPNQTIVCDEPGSGDPFHAMGLGCTRDPTLGIPIARAQHSSDDASAWRVLSQFGNAHWEPRAGAGMLLLSTGRLPQPDRARYLSVDIGHTDSVDLGSNANPDGVELAAPIRVESGSGLNPFEDCDGVNDCSNTLAGAWDADGRAHDLQWLRFEARVPQGVQSFSLAAAWFSAEFPRRVESPEHRYDDLFAVWMTGREFTGNVAAFSSGGAMDAAGLATHLLTGSGHLSTDSPVLLNTGFQGSTGRPCSIRGWDFGDCPRGAASGWMRVRAPVSPGETIIVAVALFDQGDDQYDTMALLDDFRWHCEACRFETGCAGLHPL